ncbi:hypothetical protein BpHYR1_034881 [Brachionus plicatilis]|uniref:Uncharacterized protein n=1 Tax=Brachionus plicatilis TaxID=10195 RepID=A0A3M7PCS3_BRAPC|nr:hypothetical protein BpHYR1_034881 [Brachionus plicatilis]
MCNVQGATIGDLLVGHLRKLVLLTCAAAFMKFKTLVLSELHIFDSKFMPKNQNIMREVERNI